MVADLMVVAGDWRRTDELGHEFQVTIPGQSGRDSPDFTQEAGPVDLIEGVLQVQGQEAQSFVVVVARSHRLME